MYTIGFLAKKCKRDRNVMSKDIFEDETIMKALPALKGYQEGKRRKFYPSEWEYLKSYFLGESKVA